MASQVNQSTKRAAADMEGDSTEVLANTTAKKAKSVAATQTKDDVRKLKNIPKFLHSTNNQAYFSKQWWKEMLVKDEFWVLLDKHLTQAMRNKRLRAVINTGVNSPAEPRTKRQTQPNIVRDTIVATKKVKPKRAAISVDMEADTTDIETCGICDNEIESGEQSYDGLKGTKVCRSCHSAADDNEAQSSKLSNVKLESQDIPSAIGPPAVAQGQPHKATSVNSTTYPSSICFEENDAKSSQSTLKVEPEAKLPTMVGKQDDDINAALEAFNSRIRVKREYISIE